MIDSPSQPITHRRVMKIALPIVVSNATVPLLGAVDTGVIGQLGLAAPIGAVGLGAVILASIYWIFGFLRMGTSGLAAQAHGKGDGAERTAILLRALLVALCAGLVLILAQGTGDGRRLSTCPGKPRGRRPDAAVSCDPHLGCPCNNLALCRHRLVGGVGTHTRCFGAATLD